MNRHRQCVDNKLHNKETLAIDLLACCGQVEINFGTPTKTLTLDHMEAYRFAETLMEKALDAFNQVEYIKSCTVQTKLEVGD